MALAQLMVTGSKRMKLLLRWEVDYCINTLKLDFFSVAIYSQELLLLNALQVDLTVDEIRRKVFGAAFPPHPDSVRGSAFFWQTETSQTGDATMPNPLPAEWQTYVASLSPPAS